MSVKEAAKRLEVSVSLIYKLVSEGRLSCVRIGRHGKRGTIRIRERDIEQFIKSLEE